MARNPNLTQDKLDLLARIPKDVIETLSSGVKTQADLQAIILGLKSKIIPKFVTLQLTIYILQRFWGVHFICGSQHLKHKSLLFYPVNC